MNKILIIDDNLGIFTALNVLFSLHDIESVHADSPAVALEYLQNFDVDLVIQDMNFSDDTTSGKEGEALFHEIHSAYPELPVILLTAWGHIEMAVKLIKDGASDYITKPWDDTKLISTVNNLIELHQLRQDNRQALLEKQQEQEQLKSQFDLRGTVFQSRGMKDSIKMATQVAPADIPVLITGPNGSGKEKIAEIIQANSKRAGSPFIRVNVGALPVDLLEAELFGAVAGAYTGAQKARVGRFESADGGTLFLDEIGTLPLSGQVKLLRVLQTGEFERLGSSETKKINVRILSATNANLLEEIGNGNFREDLYYRLNVIEIKVPGLAERKDDILPLALHFLPDDYVLSREAEIALENHAWPGNVRELENTIKRVSLLSTDKIITKELLGFNSPTEKPAAPAKDLGPALIESTLKANNYNISQSAKQLGLSRQSLYRRMKKYSISEGL